MAPLMTRQTAVSSAAFSMAVFVAAAAGERRAGAEADARQLEDAPSFGSFIDVYGRAYREGSAEYEERRTLYEQRVAEVHHHNSKQQRRWTAGINGLADRTSEELRSLRGWKRTGLSDEQLALAQVGESGPSRKADPLPEQVNWHFLNSSKKQWEQGACGSCWAIASVALLEMHSEIYPVPDRTFSAQDLVSCVKNPNHCGGKGKCEGATIELALDHAWKNGVATEKDVPYLGTNGVCEKPPSGFLEVGARPRRRLRSAAGGNAQGTAQLLSWERSKFGMTGFRKLPSNQYLPLMEAVLEGPVGVSVAARDWSLYRSGVFECVSKDAIIDHAVVLLGYGKEELGKYWLLKNSWGEDWGINGMMKLLRHDEEETFCGIDDQPELGSGCDGGPSEVEVCGSCGILYDTVMPQFSGAVPASLRQQALDSKETDLVADSGSMFW
mmetsp:Transcript_42108/g.75321  ORF Transcript_42108/g.75321 Transcript_42108/m.75321 type:complete len:440 (+) Transcript_42108:99-1418(+)